MALHMLGRVVNTSQMLMCSRGTQVNLPYHIRVLVPCYKESFDIVTRTIMVSLITHNVTMSVKI